jgi:hypothetical protein
MRQLLIAHEDYMRRHGERHSIKFYRRRNFLVRITHELSNSCEDFSQRKKTAQ